MKQNIRKIMKWITLFVCLIGFIFLAEKVYSKEIMKLDIWGYKLISTYLISDFATPIAKLITCFGGVIFLVSFSILSIILIKNKKIGISIDSNLVIVSVLNITLKQILQRPRPNELRFINESGYSFPSGHSMISAAFYGLIIYLIHKYVKNKYVKWILTIILSILIVSIGISRIYLGVHYTSDVLAGFLVAISYLVIYITVIKKFILERD